MVSEPVYLISPPPSFIGSLQRKSANPQMSLLQKTTIDLYPATISINKPYIDLVSYGNATLAFIS